MKYLSQIWLGLVMLWVTQVQAIGTSGATPAATLLLPYFEIDQTPNYPDDPAEPATAALQKPGKMMQSKTAQSRIRSICR